MDKIVLSLTEKPNQSTESGLACEFSAIEAAQRQSHLDVARQLFAGRQPLQELDDGYLYAYSAEEYEIVTRFVANERRCCPFWHFTVEVLPNQEAVHLRMRGPSGIKQVLQSAIHNFESFIQN